MSRRSSTSAPSASFSPPPARLGLHYENPKNWPAWNQDWEDRQKPAKSFVAGPARIRIAERGAARVRPRGHAANARLNLHAAHQPRRGGPGRPPTALLRHRHRLALASAPSAPPSPSPSPAPPRRTHPDRRHRARQREPQAVRVRVPQWFDLTGEKSGKPDYASDPVRQQVRRRQALRHHRPPPLLHTPGTRAATRPGHAGPGASPRVLRDLRARNDWTQARHTASLALQPAPHPLPRHAPAGPLGKTFSLATAVRPNVAISAMKKAEEATS